MKILLIYYSQTGFTERYSKIIAKELDCKIINYYDIKKEKIKEYNTIIFGTRIIAGKIEKINNIKRLVKKNNIKNLIVFTTGSTPNEAKEILEKMWINNLSKEELNSIPHFHMQSGMNLEELPIIENTMINMAKKMIQKKKNKTKEDIEFETSISHSFDISNEKYTKDLIKYVKNIKHN